MYLCVWSINCASFYDFEFDCGIVLTVCYSFNSGLSVSIIGCSQHNDCSGTNKKKGDNSHLKVSLLVLLLSIISSAKCIVLVACCVELVESCPVHD